MAAVAAPGGAGVHLQTVKRGQVVAADREGSVFVELEGREIFLHGAIAVGRLRAPLTVSLPMIAFCRRFAFDQTEGPLLGPAAAVQARCPA